MWITFVDNVDDPILIHKIHVKTVCMSLLIILAAHIFNKTSASISTKPSTEKSLFRQRISGLIHESTAPIKSTADL